MNREYQLILDFFPQRRQQRPLPLEADEVELLICENRRWNNSEAASANARALGAAETFAVVTGQQAGLFLGPLYTIYKALAAIRLAERLTRDLAATVVPVFWIASEDHDLEEAGRVVWLNAEGELLEKHYQPADHLPGQSMFQLRTDPQLTEWLAELDAPEQRADFNAEVLEFLRRSLAESDNLEDLFARQLARLFGAYGLVLLSPRMDFIRKRGAKVLKREFEHPGETSRLVRAAAAGKAAIHRAENAVNAFYYDERRRRLKLEWDGGNYRVGDAEHKAQAELLAELEADPARFSYNVVTRPVVQDAALPTLAYVAGPGELEYFEQLPEVYRFFETPMPVIYPRPAAVLIEARVRRALERMQLGAEEFLALDDSQLRARLARNAGGELIFDFEAILSEFDETLEHLQSALKGLDPAVERSLIRLAQGIETGRGKLRERVEHHLVQKNSALELSRRKALTALRPLGQPQERVLNVWAPFLLRRGWGLIEHLHLKLRHQERINFIEI